jgi:hypothetical protein
MECLESVIIVYKTFSAVGNRFFIFAMYYKHILQLCNLDEAALQPTDWDSQKCMENFC